MAGNFTPPMVNGFLRAWSVRGPQIIAQLQAIQQLAATSPVDLSPVVGPAILLEQSFAKAQRSLLAFMLNDASFATFSLDLQDQIAKAAVLWSELFAVTGNVAFYDKLPSVAALLTTSPSAQLYSTRALTSATTADLRLESFLSVPTLAGLTIKTFWSYTQEAVEALSRLLVIDYVVSSDPITYYGPNGTIKNLIADAQLVLSGLGPLAPSVQAVLTQINAAVAAGYTDTTAFTISSLLLPSDASLQQLAAQIYGDPDLFKQLADFNGLAYPYISDDPIVQLGPPKQLGVQLVNDSPAGSSSLVLTNLAGYMQDDRLLLQYEGHLQVVTITSGAGAGGLPSWDPITDIDTLTNIDTASASSAFSWDALPPSSYDFEAQNFTVTFTPPTDIAYGAANTIVTLYPAVYDAGVVLGTGAKLLVPNVLGQRTATIIDNNYTDTQRLGTDVATDKDGNLTITQGDLTTVTGVNNLKQALINRFKVERGMLIHHPLYGTALLGYLGKQVTPNASFMATVDATQTALADPRVSKLNQIQSEVANDAITIEFNVTMANGVLAFPANLELTVPVQ